LKRIFVVAGILLLVVLVALLLAEQGAAFGSSLSRGGGGWLAARAYLEDSERQIELIDRPLELVELDKASTLFLVMPWARPMSDEGLAALNTHLHRGGSVVFAFAEMKSPGEKSLLPALSLEPSLALRRRPPLEPRSWWRFQKERFALSPEPTSPVQRPLEAAAFPLGPTAPPEARVFFRHEGPTDVDDPKSGSTAYPVIFSYTLHKGQVLVLPAALLSNREIQQAGNADLLEWINATFTGPILFDEYHHGLVDPTVVPDSETRFSWDFFIFQCLLIYAVALWHLGRPFGPTWREKRPTYGSVAAYLKQLGVLHHRLGHHSAAGKLLIERATALDPRLKLGDLAADAASGRQLVNLGREVAARQQQKSRSL
jgi:hypothetical protein